MNNNIFLHNIAIVEDEVDIAELIKLSLEKVSLNVKTYYNAKTFLTSLNSVIPTLLVLDLMLPDADGIDICKYLKSNEKYSSIIILILTAKSEEIDRILGLEMGSDDYMTKPFSPRELVARVRALLRRNVQSEKKNEYKISNLFVNLNKHETIVNGEKVELTTTEFCILTLLMEYPGWVFSREQIITRIGSQDKNILDRTIDVHIKNLRDKIGEMGKLIKNIRSIGYKIEDN